ncbi:hypothetical protein SEA_JAYCOOKIE_52 [Arthrobacter phage JayCookie]|uniref:DNA-binding phage zinc finger domain-containing protein n=1 Tax=Arthrobacter phage JayCookie TaxID=2027885 RepID=A0A249XNF3_9CAUD|nr:hypothetical protein SEA_JAYCOOKIE_52 [Arthrobacter phage JayCookie]
MDSMSNAAIALMAATQWATAETHTPSQVTADADIFKSWLDGHDNAWKINHAVQCPYCAAAPGNVCRDTNTNAPMAHPHAAREDAAK